MRSSLVGVSALLAACATASSPKTTTTTPTQTRHVPREAALPPVPLVTGALKPVVVYPVANSLVEARDSNFIFGDRHVGFWRKPWWSCLASSAGRRRSR